MEEAALSCGECPLNAHTAANLTTSEQRNNTQEADVMSYETRTYILKQMLAFFHVD